MGAGARAERDFSSQVSSRLFQRTCTSVSWAWGERASDAGVVADGGRPRHIARAVDPLLERAQALVDPSAGERADVNIDDLGQFGGLGCREVARRDRSRDA